VTGLKELSEYKLDFMGVHEITWEGVGTESAEEYKIFCGNGMRILN
jgi:hypothetical protein